MYEGTVKANATPYLNVRNAPDGTVVGKLYPGTAVVIEYIQNGWGKLTDPVVSNNPDRQWVDVSFLDLVEPQPEEPGGETPVEEPGTVRTDTIHVSFIYDDDGNLVRLSVLEQYSDGTSLQREFFPNA